MTKIRDIIKSIAKLKPVPQVINKILEIQQDPDSSMEELASVITHDAITTANLLRAANSAYFVRAKPFESVQQAVVFLGMDEVVDLVIISSSAANLNQSQEGYGLKAGDLWRNGVSSALICRELSRKMELSNPHLIFTGALLKDIGKVILDQYVGARAKEIYALVEKEKHSFEEAEKKVIGIDHAELGAMAAAVWRFSPEMIEIIKHHHQPCDAKKAWKEAAVVHLSDILCMMMGIGTGPGGLAHRCDQDMIISMGLTDQDIQEVMAGFSCKLEDVENLVAMN
jgi:putative nucleotidyltransferase with HDIG domain